VVLAATVMASILSRPARRAFRPETADDEQRIVDADGQTHEQDHLGVQLHQRIDLADQGGDTDGGEYGADGHRQRYHRCNKRPERQDQNH